MKRLLIVSLIGLLYYSSNAQHAYTDSLRAVLVKSVKPMERFSLANSLLEYGYITGEGNPDSSYCIDLLRISQQLNNDSLLAVAYNQVGNYFFRVRGDFSSAIEYFFKGIPFAEATHDKRRLSSLYIDIAAVYAKLDNAAEQIKYVRKAVADLPEKNSPLYHFVAAQVYYYMSEYFLGQGKYDSVWHYVQVLNEVNVSLKSRMFESAIQGLMGVLYEKKNDTALAALHMARAILLSDSVQYLFGRIEGKLRYINYLIRSRRMTEARKEALLLMDVGIQKNNLDVKKAAAGFLAIVYDSNHQPDSALYYSRQESAMKDSVFSQANLNKIQALVFNERLRGIEEEDKKTAEAEQRRLNLQYALIAFGIISFVIAFLLLSRRHITNTKAIRFFGVVALLVIFEFLNLLLHPFLEHITHHSPLLMLLSLVCIAALLVPLHHRLEKWTTQKLVEKNKQARLRAAKKTIEQLEKSTS